MNKGDILLAAKKMGIDAHHLTFSRKLEWHAVDGRLALSQARRDPNSGRVTLFMDALQDDDALEILQQCVTGGIVLKGRYIQDPDTGLFEGSEPGPGGDEDGEARPLDLGTEAPGSFSAEAKIKLHVNPLTPPKQVAEKLSRKLNRKPESGEPKTPSINFDKRVRLGKVSFDQWKSRVSTFLSPKEIKAARAWYSSALPTYEHYFGKELAAPMMGAWLIANVHVTPAGAVLNAVRTLEQSLNKTPMFSAQKQGGLTDAKLRAYWDAILAGNGEKLEQAGSGQKVFDFIDSALGKSTRTFYGDDPRAGAPAVADIWSLRDMGFVDRATINWVKDKYGATAAKKLQQDSADLSPGEAQYEWTADKIRDFTSKLNAEKFDGGKWTPEQVQAVGWTAMRKLFGDDPVSPAEALEAHIRNLSYELDFGAGAPFNTKFPEWSKLDSEQKARITHEIMPKILDFATELSGAHEFARIEGVGGWHEYTNPSYKSRLIASEEVAGDVADVIGYLAQQTKIYGYRAEPGGNKIGIAVYGKGLEDQTKIKAIWDEIVKDNPKAASGFSPSINANGVRGMEIILDKGGEKASEYIHKALMPSIERIAAKLGVDVEVSGFKAREISRGNDWTKNTKGESYLERLSVRYGPHLQSRLESFSRKELEPAIAATIRREIAGSGKRLTKDWDESEHPRDEDGKFTFGGGSEDEGGGDGSTETAVSDYKPGISFRGTARAAKEIKNEWAAKSAVKTADAMIAAAPVAQGQLVKAGMAAGRKLGVQFKNPGSKVINQSGIDRLKVKIATRGGVASRISDAARIGFVVSHPQQTEAIAKELAKHFEVALEDWRMTDAGYMDRAITVRMPSGIMAEVQMMDPWTAKAKSKVEHGGGGGHEIYDKWRKLNPSSDNPAELKEYDDLLAKMRKLYGDAMQNYTPEWRAALLTD